VCTDLKFFNLRRQLLNQNRLLKLRISLLPIL
jgi:hypothetical protein